METVNAVEKGISSGGLEFLAAMLIVALASMFWLYVRQRDRYETKQEETKKELIAVYDKHVQQGQQSLEMQKATAKALDRIQKMLPKPIQTRADSGHEGDD